MPVIRHPSPRRMALGGRAGAWVLAVAATSTLIATAALQLRWLSDRSVPRFDWGFIELGTRAATRFDQFVGPYSRLGWFHPGPAMFYWLAPFYVVGGRRFTGVVIGAVVFQLLCLLAIAWALDHLVGRRALAAGAVTVALFLWRFDVRVLRDPWNPYLVALPIALVMVLAAASAVSPRPWIVPVVGVFASFAAQTHLSAVMPAVGAVILTTVCVARSTMVHRARSIAIGGALTAVMWLPPLWNEVHQSHPNLTAIVASPGGAEAGGHSVLAPLRLLVVMLAGIRRLGPTFGSASAFGAPVRPTVVEIVVSVVVATSIGAIALGAVTADRFARMLAAVALVGLLTMALSGAAVRGPLYPYLMMPAVGATLVAWLSIVVAASERIAMRWPVAVAWLAAATVAVVSLIAVPTVVSGRNSFAAIAGDERTDRLAASLAPACRLADHDLFVATDPESTFDVVVVAVALERCGHHVVVGEDLFSVFGTVHTGDRAGKATVSITHFGTTATGSQRLFVDPDAIVDLLPAR